MEDSDLSSDANQATEKNIESLVKQKRLFSEDDVSVSDDEDYFDEVYSESREPDISKKVKRASFTDLPDLDSDDMREYSKQRLKTAPSWIQNWLTSKEFAAGLNLDQV